MDKKINASWSKFLLVCGLIIAVPLGFMYITWDEAGLRASTIVTMLALASLLAFFAGGWARLREAHRIEPIHVTETDKIRALLRGPRKLRVIWFSTTILFVILSALVTGLMGTMK